jgi:putative redox protein
MKILLQRVNDTVRFDAVNARGHRVKMEGGTRFGGNDTAPSPMELLLMSQAGCTAMDVVALLKKMNQQLLHIELETEGFRDQGQVPKVFSHIHVHYRLYGTIKAEKAEKAIRMSLEKYCPVSRMINQVCRITHSFEILDQPQSRMEQHQ